MTRFPAQHILVNELKARVSNNHAALFGQGLLTDVIVIEIEESAEVSSLIQLALPFTEPYTIR